MPTKQGAIQPAQAKRAYAASLRRLRDEQLACRDMRHAWEVDQDFHVVPSQSAGRRKVLALRRIWSCSRNCGVTKVQNFDVINDVLHFVSSYLKYPRDYQIPGIPRGVRPSIIVQQEAYRRAMERVAGMSSAEAQ